MYDGITSNLPIKRHGYIAALIVLAIVFSMAWHKIVIQRSLVAYHEISHLSLVFSWYTSSPNLARGDCTRSTYERPSEVVGQHVLKALFCTSLGLSFLPA